MRIVSSFIIALCALALPVGGSASPCGALRATLEGVDGETATLRITNASPGDVTLILVEPSVPEVGRIVDGKYRRERTGKETEDLAVAIAYTVADRRFPTESIARNGACERFTHAVAPRRSVLTTIPRELLGRNEVLRIEYLCGSSDDLSVLANEPEILEVSLLDL